MEIWWGVVLFVGGQRKWQHTGKDAAKFKMKFILKQYEQKSATHVFISKISCRAIPTKQLTTFIFVLL